MKRRLMGMLKQKLAPAFEENIRTGWGVNEGKSDQLERFVARKLASGTVQEQLIEIFSGRPDATEEALGLFLGIFHEAYGPTALNGDDRCQELAFAAVFLHASFHTSTEDLSTEIEILTHIEAREHLLAILRNKLADPPEGLFGEILIGRHDRANRMPSFAVFENGKQWLLGAEIPKFFNAKQKTHFDEWRHEVMMELTSALETERQEIERLLSLNIDPEVHLDTLVAQLDEGTFQKFLPAKRASLIDLYRAIHELFEGDGTLAANHLAAIPKDVHRITQLETVIDLYNEKIHRTENDDSLSDNVRDRKVQALQHLMEKDIEALGGAV